MENMENRFKYLGEAIGVVVGITNTLTRAIEESYGVDVIRMLERYGFLLRVIGQNIKENKYFGDFLWDLMVVFQQYKDCELGLIDKLYNVFTPPYIGERLDDKQIKILSSMLAKFSSTLSNMRDTIRNDEFAYMLEKFGSSCEILGSLMEGGYMVSVALQKAKKFVNSPNPTDYEGAKKLIDTLKKALDEIWEKYDFENV
jgi:hypothetical protein